MRYQTNQNRFLIDEAAAITCDLGDVTFIGAVAVLLHTNKGRESRDLDFSMAYEITDEQLFKKGYIKNGNSRNRYTTPRGFSVDIYKSEPINGIPIKTITSTATEFSSKRKRPKVVKAVKLEILIIMKFRSRGAKHDHDLYTLAASKYNEIDWNVLGDIITDQTEINRIRSTINTINKIPLE